MTFRIVRKFWYIDAMQGIKRTPYINHNEINLVLSRGDRQPMSRGDRQPMSRIDRQLLDASSKVAVPVNEN